MSAYLTALRMLAGRDLSEAQVRERLARRQYPNDEIELAVERLRQERALDDERVAAAIARTQTSIKRRGEWRVRRQIEQAGISSEAARRAARSVFEATDVDALLESALARRLRSGTIADEREFVRLYRHLVRQGFEPDRVRAALEKRKRP
jgi:regulatory protein